LCIAQQNGQYQCFAPDIEQHHVINHLNGKEMPEKRNVLIESARIARGDIKNLKEYHASDFDALILPGGFGAAKNLTKWAFAGPDGNINEDVKNAIAQTVLFNKPVCGLCMAPAVIAKALQNSNYKVHLTVGTDKEKSPYDIAAIAAGINSTGAIAEMKNIHEIAVDPKNKIITAPCYMMDATITDVYNNIQTAVSKLFELIN
jgi:enhancing lycopene biosynthesis protein 2